MFFLIHVLFSLFNQINADLTDIDTNLAKHEFGTPQTLALDTLFTCPSDGYLLVSMGYQATNYVSATFNGIADAITFCGASSLGVNAPISVRKNMTVTLTARGGNGKITFYPLA